MIDRDPFIIRTHVEQRIERLQNVARRGRGNRRPAAWRRLTGLALLRLGTAILGGPGQTPPLLSTGFSG